MAENKRRPFDLIECPDFAGWLPFGAPGGVPLIVRLHGSNLFFDEELLRKGNPFEHSLEKKLLSRAEFLVSPSQYAAGRTLRTAGMGGRPVTIIPHAVDANLFRPETGRGNFEQGLIVFANSVSPKKGIQELCEAMNGVCRDSTTARLAIAGGETYRPPSGGSYREFLLARVEPGNRARIDFAGRLDRETGVLPLLQKAHVCCYPSHMETFGLAPLEAMAVGKPVIYSKTGPGPEIIEDGVSGLLCDPRRPEEIASRILRVLGDAGLAAKLGANARTRVLDLFEKGKWIARNVAYYETCLQAAAEETRREMRDQG